MEALKGQKLDTTIRSWEDDIRFLVDEKGERQGVVITPEQYDLVSEYLNERKNLRDNLVEALREVKDFMEGKTQLMTWEEFRDEL